MRLRTFKRGCTLAVFPFCICLRVFGQDPSASVVVSPSPTSSIIASYSEVPVHESTGIPQINIPLYAIRSTQLSYPISISYGASGIKVADVAGPLGTGWALNAGGMINRIMRNRPDEQANGFFSYASAIPDETDALSLYTKDDLANKVTDMMPDLFYYSTAGMAGEMMFDNQLVPRSIPQNSLKISVSSTATLANFTMTDPSGTVFEFEPGETATVSYQGIPGAGATYLSSWYLTRIVSADRTDTIRFNYTVNASYSYTTSLNSALNFFYNAPPNASKEANEITPISSSVTATVTGTRYLSSIEYKSGKVTFSFSDNRTDDPNGKKLDQITIYDRDPVLGTYVQDKSIVFSYSYFQNTDSGTRLRLDSFREKLDATTFNPPYTFAYSAKQLPSPSSFAQDHWGYYNGAITNTSLIPAYTHQPGGLVVSTNDREVNPSFVDGCMIESITSPLGGVTEFVFESNSYLNGTTDSYGPGMRIQKIIKRDPFSVIASTSNYDYVDPSTGKSSGRLMDAPDYFTDLDVFDDIHAAGYNYNCLLIKTNATSVGNFSGAPVIYEYVTTYSNDDVAFAGKTVSKFSVYSPTTITFPYFPVDDNSWSAGDLLTQEVFAYESGSFRTVKRIENSYEESPYSFTIKGLSAARNKLFFFSTPGVNDFIVKNYVTSSKFRYLKESKVYDYEQGSGTNTLTTTTYSYDKTDIHLFPTSNEITTSLSAEKIRNEFTYVADGPSTGVNGVMKNLKMTGLPLEVSSYLVRNGTEYVTDYKKTEYFEWAPGRVYPEHLYGSKIPTGLLRSTFEANPANYSRLTSSINAYTEEGIAMETEVTGGNPQSIIVDKKFNRVVASASPASANQIAYTSFESSDFGNWKITTGTTSTTVHDVLNYGTTHTSISLPASLTVSYTWQVTQSNGPGMHLIFSQGASTIDQYLTGSTGSGSVSLAPGTWDVNLTYDINVTAVTVDLSYQRVTQNLPSITSDFSKTGDRSLQLGASQVVYQDGLPSGNYTVVLYQKGGTATVTATGGASVLSTATSATEPDGWTKVQKEVAISGTSQRIELTGTNTIYIDELRLHPAGSFMATTCYDLHKNVITQTDINLRSQFTEYDEWRRTKITRDHDKNILQHYDYKLAIH